MSGSDFDGFDFLLTADPSTRSADFHVTRVINGYGGLDIRNLRIKTEPKIYIMVSVKSPFYDPAEVVAGH